MVPLGPGGRPERRLGAVKPKKRRAREQPDHAEHVLLGRAPERERGAHKPESLSDADGPVQLQCEPDQVVGEHVERAAVDALLLYRALADPAHDRGRLVLVVGAVGYDQAARRRAAAVPAAADPLDQL